MKKPTALGRMITFKLHSGSLKGYFFGILMNCYRVTRYHSPYYDIVSSKQELLSYKVIYYNLLFSYIMIPSGFVIT